jgi:hypothetical protein
MAMCQTNQVQLHNWTLGCGVGGSALLTRHWDVVFSALTANCARQRASW